MQGRDHSSKDSRVRIPTIAKNIADSQGHCCVVGLIIYTERIIQLEGPFYSYRPMM